MARRQGVFPQANFIKGLITETSVLGFPENACTETWNCIFNYNGEVTRRLGLDVEAGYVFRPKETTIDTDKYQSFLWQTVGTQDDVSYVVQQTGRYVRFFTVNESLSITSEEPFSTIDMEDYVPSGSTADPATFYCSFAEGRGSLVIVNSAIDPLLVQYEESTGNFSVNTITIKYRDFTGVDDGHLLNERPTHSAASLATDDPAHYYNILNQGWHLTEALTQWDAARTDMPSNSDVVSYYRASDTDPFDNARVNTFSSAVLSTPAPKGHFILDAGSPSRTQALDDEGFTAVVPERNVTTVDISTANTFSGGTVNNPAACFDGNTFQTQAQSTGLGFQSAIGKELLAPTTIKAISFVIPTNGTNSGTLQFYGKTGSQPSTGTDGTLLASITFGGGTSTRRAITLASEDEVTEWEWVWAYNPNASSKHIAEINWLTHSDTYFRPSVVAFYSGRIFYGGLPNEGNENSVYFSQIIERDAQFGQCYQKNDPTGEEFFDLLPDDGGVITIPEMGRLVYLFNFQAGLVAVATNGVWIISGSSRAPFTAQDYSIRKISSISTSSRTSLVDYKGIPIWWAEDGIYVLQYDPNFDSFSVASVTDDTIKSFIEEIPLDQRLLVKGTYDMRDDKIFWIITLDSGEMYTQVLCMDGRTKAFYPWRMEDPTLHIKDIIQVRNPVGLAVPRVKYYAERSDGESFVYCEFENTDYTDWSTFAAEVGTSADVRDYDSYFVTAPSIHGQTQKFFQANYIFVFLQQETDASLFVQGIHDLHTTVDSARWSTPQQAYNTSFTVDQTMRHRRLKIRGKGRILQLKMYSESGKPFTCIGWSTNESVNEQI